MRLTAHLAIFLLVPALALAQAPNKLGYQGRLLKADGSPESGTKTFEFALYDVATGGTALWSESQTLALSDGYYATQLGATADLFSASPRYLSLKVDGSELLPRQEVGSVAWAMWATNLSGGTVSASSVTVTGGTVSVGGATLSGSGLSLGNGGTVTVGGTSIVDGSGKLPASQLSGTVPLSSLPSGIDAATLAGHPVSDFELASGNDFVRNNATATAQSASFFVSGTGAVSGTLNVGVPPANKAKLRVQGDPALTTAAGGIGGTAGSSDITGVSTTFNSDVVSGDILVVAGQTLQVASVTDDTHLKIAAPLTATITASGGNYTIQKAIARLQKGGGSDGVVVNALSDLSTTGRLIRVYGSTAMSIGGVYCGKSANATTGNVSSGALTGYPATKAICEATCAHAAAHICSAEEISRSFQVGALTPYTWGENLWYSTVVRQDPASVIDDCDGWQCGQTGRMACSSEIGPMLQAADRMINSAFCTASMRIACCL